MEKWTKPASWLWVPARQEGDVLPPVRTRPQELPLNELRWEAFQRLCARLAQRAGDVEFCQEYGLPGQAQDGIDLYLRRRSTDTFSVWQCKCYQTLTRKDIRDAVDEFEGGNWRSRANEFVLCVSFHTEERNLADEIEVQSARLREHGAAFIPQGITQLSQLLKVHPDLVDDFFGRPWVDEFCGREAAALLSRRVLPPGEVSRLRRLLRNCYENHFEAVDPGLPLLASAVSRGPQPFSLLERFILPDVLEPREIASALSAPRGRAVEAADQAPAAAPGPSGPSPGAQEPARMVALTTEVRRSALDWLGEGDLSVVIGDPGMGKSSLVRYVLLDLLSPEPRHEALAMRWGNDLPVWVPFAMWTRMVAESESACSLSDVLSTWLRKVCAPEELITLVQQAMGDSRLHLFVDGLDEWSNETAARSTVALLEHFVGERHVPAIATSRPLGFELLGGLSGKWRRAKLAGFTPDQQREFARRWFVHRARSSVSTGDPDRMLEAERYATAEAAELVESLQRDGRLNTLAEVPLLLSGLVTLGAQHVELPRTRFKAYEELTRLLLEEQPQRRAKAAHARSPLDDLGLETRERALAQLAYHVHKAPGSDSIEKAVACQVLAGFFTAQRGKSPGEAVELSERAVAVAAETMGVLVDKSPQEVGFIHRALQEFLAARYLSGLPFGEQRELFRALFGDPQWHDVLLCLCHLNRRVDEVDALMEIAANATLPPELEASREVFLAQVAFGDLHCSAEIALGTATRAFTKIENGTWMVLRERLLEHAIDGLFSDILRRETEKRITRWYPARHSSRGMVYAGMGDWPREPETLDALWRGLLDEEGLEERAAAEALAKSFGGDPAVGERLRRLMCAPAEPNVTALTLHALCLGWGGEPRLPGALNEARQVADLTLRLVAIIHRVRRQEHDRQDYEELLEITSGTESLDWHWRDDSVRALVGGWPRDRRTKDAAIKSLSARWFFEGPMTWDFAGLVLMRGFPQDDDAATAIAELFRSEQYPEQHLGLGLGPDWAPLAASFGRHPLLVDALDDWLERRRVQWGDYRCCLVSKSPRAKRLLLQPPEKKGGITEHQALVLLEGWGMADREAAQALTTLAESEVASRAASLMPSIMPDTKACRSRLLTWLREEDEAIAGRALVGLLKLGCNYADTEVADAAAEKYSGRLPCGITWGGVFTVISGFPEHPRVRELALHQVRNRGGAISAVAHAYKCDPEMRREVLLAITTVPWPLRLRIVDRLSRSATQDEFSLQLLSQYDQDTDEQVKTAAAMGYARSTALRGDSQSAVIQELSEGLVCMGLDCAERRRAAFAGLLELKRLDIVGSEDQRGAGRSIVLQFDGPGMTNMRLASHLAKNWEVIRDAFGTAIWDKVGYVPGEVLEEIASKVRGNDELERIIAKIDGNSGVSPSVETVRLRSHQWRGTDQLRSLCIDLISHFYPRDWVHAAPCILAAEVLAEQFGNDMGTGQELESLANDAPNPTPLIIALCSAWPDSPALRPLSEPSRGAHLLLPATFHLLARFEPGEGFISRMSRILGQLTGDIWEFLPTCVRAIRGRFQRDIHLRDLAFARLENGASPGEKANLPQFLRHSDTRVERLLEWRRREYGRQIAGEHVPDFALDMFTGRVRPLGHLLLEFA